MEIRDNITERTKSCPGADMEATTIDSLQSLAEYRKIKLQEQYEHNHRVAILSITERNQRTNK